MSGLSPSFLRPGRKRRRGLPRTGAGGASIGTRSWTKSSRRPSRGTPISSLPPRLVHARGGNDEIGVPREGLLDDFVQLLVPIDAPPAPVLGKPRRRFLPGRRNLDLRPLIGRLRRASRQQQNQTTREDVAHDAGAAPGRA